MWTECLIIDFHKYFKNLHLKAKEIQENPQKDWWTAKIRPELAKVAHFHESDMMMMMMH